MKRKAALFTSAREKRLWLWALAVLLAIFAALFVGQPLANHLRDQNVQAIFFVVGMALVAAAMVVHGLMTKPSKAEWSLRLGILAVYTMLVFRLGAPERSHLIEYSVLAIFIHKALLERAHLRKPPLKPALAAWILAFLIGIVDEGLQILIPNRVFDPEDILFNVLAVTMAIVSSVLLNGLRQRMRTSKK